MAPGPSRGREFALAASLFVLALVVRCVGLAHLTPHSPEPDAVYALQPGFLAAPTTNPEYASYPYLVGWLAAQWPTDDDGVLAADGEVTREERLERAAAPLVRVRWIVAGFAALLAPATYWIARSFFGVGWSFVAGLFAASSLMHLNLSQQGRPHAALAATLALAVAFAIRARRSGAFRDWCFASAAAALALAILQSGIFACAGLAAAFVLRERATRRDWAFWLGTVALFAATFWTAYPFLRPGELAQWSRASSDKLQFGGHNLVFAKFDGLGLVVMLEGLWRHDPALLVAAACGVFAAWRSLRTTRGDDAWRAGRRDAAVLAAVSVAYALVFGLYHGTLDRFALPLVAALAVLAAAGVRAIAGFVSARSAWQAALAACVLALPCLAAAKLAWLRSRPDTLELAAQWIDRELPADARIVLQPWFELPLATAHSALARDADRRRAELRYFWARHERAFPARDGRELAVLPDGRAPFWSELATTLEPELDALGATHVVCFRAQEDPYKARTDALRGLVSARGASLLLVRALPPGAGGFGSLQYESPTFLADVLAATRVGPEVEVFARARLAAPTDASNLGR